MAPLWFRDFEQQLWYHLWSPRHLPLILVKSGQWVAWKENDKSSSTLETSIVIFSPFSGEWASRLEEDWAAGRMASKIWRVGRSSAGPPLQKPSRMSQDAELIIAILDAWSVPQDWGTPENERFPKFIPWRGWCLGKINRDPSSNSINLWISGALGWFQHWRTLGFRTAFEDCSIGWRTSKAGNQGRPFQFVDELAWWIFCEDHEVYIT